MPIFAWNVPWISLIFLNRSLVFPILLLSSISLHWSLRKAFLSFLAILWNSAFKWVYLSFSPLLFNHFSRSVVSNSLWPHELQHTISWNSLELTSIGSVMPSSYLILCRPLHLLPSIPPSIRVFSNESTLRMRGPKHWSFSFSISPSSEHSASPDFL